MKIVTNNYECGISSSILDYRIKDVVIVSEQNYKHVFDIEDDLFFVGHDFLLYLWDNEEDLKKWIARSSKFEHWLWCFERIDAIFPIWKQKSHYSLGKASKFCKRILACDEDDCDNYKLDWMPQWASRSFYDKKNVAYLSDKILFSGQAGNPEYEIRNILLMNILEDEDLSKKVQITNISRDMTWNQYVDNMLAFRFILNPVGTLKSLNTRAYESLYSGRFLFQHTLGTYKRHEKMLKDNPGIIFFQDVNSLKKSILESTNRICNPEESYIENSLYARFNSIGIDIK